MEQEVVLARTREVGTGAAKALRRAGQIPAVLYGKGIDVYKRQEEENTSKE